MKSFYLTLISAASKNYRNTASQFINDLPEILMLDSDMEFGLSEVSYVRRLNNFEYVPGSLRIFDYEGGGGLIDVMLIDGFFSNEELCAYVNTIIRDKIPRLRNVEIFKYIAAIRRYRIDIENTSISLIFKKNFAYTLGIENDFNRDNTNEHFVIGLPTEDKTHSIFLIAAMKKFGSTLGSNLTAVLGGVQSYDSKLNMGQSIFLYCDLVLDQLTGDSFSNLLRMIPIRGRDNHRIVEKYDKIHYVPISKRHVPSIEINIKTRDDTFADLREITYVKLHFRQIREQ